ncbi:uncharacterized protein [Nerophis lumbriciformis]|uniref:uncharacterized protein n=1 Tax=Nerophis lumbriciformis TaxID=546530 RepID=UPI003BA9CFB4
MPPPKKSAQMENDIEEIRKSLNFMSGDLASVSQQLSKLTELVDEVRKLKETIRQKDKTITDLERRVENLEQYTRMEDVIITGLNIRPRSYARAATAGRNVGEDAETDDLQTLEDQVLHFLKGKDIHVDANNISACHTLPRRDRAKPAVLVRFVNRRHKTELLRQGRKLKGSAVYINEHPTKKISDIAREARILRKNNKIGATWTRNCKVFIQLNGSTPEKAKVILDIQQLLENLPPDQRERLEEYYCEKERAIFLERQGTAKALQDAAKALQDAGKARRDAGKARRDAGKALQDAGKALQDAGKAREELAQNQCKEGRFYKPRFHMSWEIVLDVNINGIQ